MGAQCSSPLYITRVAHILRVLHKKALTVIPTRQTKYIFKHNSHSFDFSIFNNELKGRFFQTFYVVAFEVGFTVWGRYLILWGATIGKKVSNQRFKSLKPTFRWFLGKVSNLDQRKISLWRASKHTNVPMGNEAEDMRSEALAQKGRISKERRIHGAPMKRRCVQHAVLEKWNYYTLLDSTLSVPVYKA